MSPAIDLTELNGKLVLVCSDQDKRNPPTGVRGTLWAVQPATGGPSVVEVELEFPQMFTTKAHARRVVLSEDEIAKMLASENRGTFMITLHTRIDPEAPSGNE